MPLRNPAQLSTVLAHVYCPSCVEAVEMAVRFRYGKPTLGLRLGEAVGFTAGAPGAPGGSRSVVADGQVEPPCACCGFDGDWPVEVWLAGDRLLAVRPPSRRFNWVCAEESWIVVEP